MSEVKQKGSKPKYSMIDRDCIGRECFAPGKYESRGATMSGSRNTGDFSYTCMQRAYHGCPHTQETENRLPAPKLELKKKRKEDGWKNV